MKERSDHFVDAMAIASPSGRMSKRALQAAQEKLRVELFGPDGLNAPSAPVIDNHKQAAFLRQRAHALRHLASHGMRPKVHTRMAEILERDADVLDGTVIEKQDS